MSAFEPSAEELARIDWRRAEAWLSARGWVRRSAGSSGRLWWMQRGEHVVTLATVNRTAALHTVADAHELDGDALRGVMHAWQGPTVARPGQVLIGPDGDRAVCLEGGTEPLYAVQLVPGGDWDILQADSVTAPWWLSIPHAMEVEP